MYKNHVLANWATESSNHCHLSIFLRDFLPIKNLFSSRRRSLFTPTTLPCSHSSKLSVSISFWHPDIILLLIIIIIVIVFNNVIIIIRKSLASTSGSGRVFFPPGRSPPYSLTTPVWCSSAWSWWSSWWWRRWKSNLYLSEDCQWVQNHLAGVPDPVNQWT